MPDNELRPLSFTIGGQKYDIRTSDDREAILRAAGIADNKVRELMKLKLTYQQALVLVILEFAQGAQDEKDRAEDYRSRLAEYLKDAEDAKLECERLKRENKRLKELLARR